MPLNKDTKETKHTHIHTLTHREGINKIIECQMLIFIHMLSRISHKNDKYLLYRFTTASVLEEYTGVKLNLIPTQWCCKFICGKLFAA